MRKVDVRLMQQANRAMVLNLVRENSTLSRAAIVRRTGLSAAAVSAIVDHLLREDLVREEGVLTTGAKGRRAQRLVFNHRARLALGIDLDVCEVSAALVDLGGTPRVVQRAEVPAGLPAPAILDLAAKVARRAMRGAARSALLGVGMAIPGMVTWPDGVNLFSPNFGWRDVPVRALMEERLAMPVLVSNEVRTLALAEHAFGAARGAQTIVFIDAGYGLGGAVIVDGVLYRGRHGAAGEFGHTTVEPNGPRCACGNLGCLEVFASVSGLLARAREALAGGCSSILAPLSEGELELGHISAAAQQGDPLATDLLARAATYLGLAVANAVDAWDPDLVVLSGPVIGAGGALFDDLLATEQRTVLEPGRGRVRVVRAALDGEAKIIGAATQVIADYLAAPLQTR